MFNILLPITWPKKTDLRAISRTLDSGTYPL
nr:unnamed protein product [Callosobruchus chinensis]